MAVPKLPLSRSDPDGSNKEWVDPFPWWKKNQVAYPILARLAKIYLAIQAISAPTERVFSVASRIMSSRRCAMSPHLAGKCLFAAENWNNYKDKLDFHDCTEDQYVED